ncbi:hypothetical protein BY996DRAFT_1400834 [Phakopsora pachyrhizi]|nr:hypothetical protein BY996DRAFT_1400834 [Phakopsora pachyrhizi]
MNDKKRAHVIEEKKKSKLIHFNFFRVSLFLSLSLSLSLSFSSCLFTCLSILSTLTVFHLNFIFFPFQPLSLIFPNLFIYLLINYYYYYNFLPNLRFKTLYTRRNTPTFNLRETIGRELNMTNREVQVWFQNRRAKYNRQRLSNPQECIPGELRHRTIGRKI